MKKKVQKKAGVLMPISALPSAYGIGDFGKHSYEFVDMLAECGIKVWQILPLNPLGFGNSPYQPYSSVAGDELYIDLETLAKQGLIKSKLPHALSREPQILYEDIRREKETYLKEAYSHFQPDAGYQKFIKQDWVYPYGVFLTMKKHNGLRCWLEWPEEQKEWPRGSGFDETVWKEDISYEMFIQYIFYSQWQALKTYANEKGIQIMGDIPFYVGIDSLDVWTKRQDFLLGADGQPTFIAGVPPDYFSATGQRWGNPIYDWEQLEKEGFAFWLNRISYTAKMFDIIRIDHFRAFDTYWKIDAACPTAIEGEWVEAPGYAFFDTLLKKYPKVNIVAEDLGLLREEVYALRDHYNLPGMDVVLFNFDPVEGDTHHCQRMITYTGTHDNETVKEWFEQKPEAEQRKCRTFLKKQGIDTRNISHAFITYAMERPAELAIVPVSDILAMGKEGRINTPGTLGAPDWCFRLTDFAKLRKQLDFLAQTVKETGRA
jgi:4-alpha-glucanotransferase